MNCIRCCSVSSDQMSHRVNPLNINTYRLNKTARKPLHSSAWALMFISVIVMWENIFFSTQRLFSMPRSLSLLLSVTLSLSLCLSPDLFFCKYCSSASQIKALLLHSSFEAKLQLIMSVVFTNLSLCHLTLNQQKAAHNNIWKRPHGRSRV